MTTYATILRVEGETVILQSKEKAGCACGDKGDGSACCSAKPPVTFQAATPPSLVLNPGDVVEVGTPSGMLLWDFIRLIVLPLGLAVTGALLFPQAQALGGLGGLVLGFLIQLPFSPSKRVKSLPQVLRVLPSFDLKTLAL